MMDADKFIEVMSSKPKINLIKYGQVDPNYSGGRPKIKFDGEDIVSGKAYPYLSSYVPTANDRVIMLDGVIMGKVI